MPELQGLNTYLALLQSAGPQQFNQQVGSQTQGSGLAPQPQPAPQGVDFQSAFRMGEQAAGSAPGGNPGDGFARGGPVRPGYAGGGPVTSDSGGLGSVSPLFLALTKAEMSRGDDIGEDDGSGFDDTPTSQDKWLALAQAGFGMAAGNSPHPLQNIGAGAVGGLNALQKMRQQRALLRMRESQFGQQTALRNAALVDVAQQKAAALAQAKDIAAEKAQAAADKLAQDKVLADEKLADKQRGDADRAAAAGDRATALAETRYNTAASARAKDYNATGVWRKLAADEDHGIMGAPEADTFSGPLINDPNLPLRDRNALKKAQPDRKQTTNVVAHNLDLTVKKAEALAKHPGLSDAVGFLGETRSNIPGTDAASFRNDLESLNSVQFAQSIQAMRDASKTGGAVGNVSDREGDRFESMVAKLGQAQDEKQFKERLQDVVDYAKYLKGTYKAKYRETYGVDSEETPEVADPLGLRGDKK